MKYCIGVQINGCSPVCLTTIPGIEEDYAVLPNKMDSFSICSLLTAAKRAKLRISQGHQAVVVVPNDHNRSPGNDQDFGQLALEWLKQNFPDVPRQRSVGRKGNNAISDVQTIAEHAVSEGFIYTEMVIFSVAIAPYFRTICSAVQKYEQPKWAYSILTAPGPNVAPRWQLKYDVINMVTGIAAQTKPTWDWYCKARDKQNANRNVAFYRTLEESRQQ